MVQSNEFQLSDIDGTFEEREYLNKDENESHKEVPEEETKNKGLLSYFSLYKYSTPIEKLLIATGIILAVVCGMAIPGMMYLYGEISGDLIDYVRATSHVTTDDDLSREQELLYSKLRSFVISTVICGLVTVIFGYFSEICFRYTAVKQVTRMRKLLLSRMLNADIEWHDLHKTTDFTTIFTENLSKIEEGLGPKMCLMICNASNFTTSIILAFHQGWLLTLASLSLFPLMLIIFWIMSWVSAKFSMDELEAYGAAGSLAEEVFSAIKTVVAFDAQKSESLRYQEHLQVAKNNNIKKSVFNGLTFFFTDCFSFLTYVITLGYGAKLVADDMLLPPNERLYTPSVCIIVINCITGAEWKFHEWIPMLEIIGTAVGAGVSVFSMLDIEPVINKSKVTGIKPSKIEGNLKFKNVEFSYHSRPGVKVLKGINFEINKGETVALVGHSGCGKSTIIQLIQRCYDPIEGNIELDGNDLKDLNLVWWRNQIGIVSQEPVLFDTTILENIRIANPDATVELIVNAAKKANAHNFISRLPHGYQTQIGEGGTQLSGGQKQRVAIARALIKKPRILLLDEATSALDTTSEAEVQAALDQIAHECTTIIVAHRLSTIRNADRIVVMEDGQIKEQGTHDELMLQQGVYYNLTKSHKSDLDESKSVQEPELDEEKITSDEMNENLTQKSPKLNTQGDGIVGKEDDMDEEESIQESCSVAYTILKYNKPEWHLIFFGCLCAMSSGAQFPVIGYILGEIIKYYGVDDGDYIVSNTKRMIIYLFISAVVAGISSGLSEVFLTVSGERLTFRLRKRMYEIMVNEEIGWHDREENGVGAICAKLSSTASYVQGASGARIGTILTGITIIIISCTISLAYNWKLALVCLSFSPIIIISSYFEHRVAVTDSETSQKILEKSAKIAVEALSNIRTVVTIGCETVFYDLYVKELEAYRQLMYRRMHLKSITEAASWSLLFFSCAAGMAYGTKLTVEGSLDSSNVFTIIEVVFTGSWAAGLILSYSSNYQEAYNAAKIVINLLERRTNTTQTHGSAVFQKGDVKYENVNFSYPTRPKVLVLEGLNLHAAEGKTVALVGGSGNGKSTVVQLLLRYYDPSSGHIYLGSHDIGKCPSSEVRRRLGVVSQEPNLFDRTIAENIAYGDQSREVSLSEIVEAARIANIHDFIGSLPLGYQTRMGHKGTQLSGGQKQRVAIARALIRKPDILLLDEATSALDNESEKIVQEALDKAREGRTCLTIAHRLTTIIDADLICVIQDGRVVETGTHAELLEKKGAYYECYKQN